MAEKFKFLVESAIEDLQPFSRHDLDFDNKYKKLLLVPLQVSAHYAFQTDTSYSNQMDFLLDVMKDVDSDTGVVVTQYEGWRRNGRILYIILYLIKSMAFHNTYCHMLIMWRHVLLRWECRPSF
ncbi:hypothetical protein NYV48_04335 [Escherichia coli]|nr:hypothetical protein [Escherichia coli]